MSKHRIGVVAAMCLFGVGCLAPESDGSLESGASKAHVVRVQGLYGQIKTFDGVSGQAATHLEESILLGRAASSAPVYEFCMQTAFAVSFLRFVTIPGSEIASSVKIGPYTGCAQGDLIEDDDPFLDSPPNEQIEKALVMTRSPNPLNISGDDSETDLRAFVAYGDQEHWMHGGDETMTFGSYLGNVAAQTAAGVPLCSNVPDGFFCSAHAYPGHEAVTAGVVWHEAAHTHGYTHGSNEQEAAMDDCGTGDLSEDVWHFQENTAPYIIGLCMQWSIAHSGQVCNSRIVGDFRLDDACAPGEVLLATSDQSADACTCYPDPRATPVDEPYGTDRAELMPYMPEAWIDASGLHAKLDIYNTGTRTAPNYAVTFRLSEKGGAVVDETIVELQDVQGPTFHEAGLGVGFAYTTAVDFSKEYVLEVFIDSSKLVGEADEADNNFSLGVELPDLDVLEMDVSPQGGLYFPLWLETEYFVRNMSPTAINSLSNARLEVKRDGIVAYQGLAAIDALGGWSSQFTSINANITAQPPTRSCQGHLYQDLRVEMRADADEDVLERDEENNATLYTTRLTYDEAPQLTTQIFSGPSTSVPFVVASPESTFEMWAKAMASDPDGDFMTLGWSLGGQPASLEPSDATKQQVKITYKASALYTLGYCVIPGTQAQVEPWVKATANDCVLTSSDVDTWGPMTLSLPAGTAQEIAIAKSSCLGVMSGGPQDLGEVFGPELAGNLGFYDPICEQLMPDPNAEGPCLGLTWLQILGQRWGQAGGLTGSALDRNAVATLRSIVERLPGADRWARGEALRELDRLAAGSRDVSGKLTAHLLTSRLVEVASLRGPSLRVVAGEPIDGQLWTGWRLSSRALAASNTQLALSPLHHRPQLGRGQSYVSELAMMGLQMPEGLKSMMELAIELPAGRSADGLKVLGFQADGRSVELPLQVDRRAGELTATLREGIYAVAVIEDRADRGLLTKRR